MFSWQNTCFFQCDCSFRDLSLRHAYLSTYYTSCFYTDYTAPMIDTLSRARVATAWLTNLRIVLLWRLKMQVTEPRWKCRLRRAIFDFTFVIVCGKLPEVPFAKNNLIFIEQSLDHWLCHFRGKYTFTKWFHSRRWYFLSLKVGHITHVLFIPSKSLVSELWNKGILIDIKKSLSVSVCARWFNLLMWWNCTPVAFEVKTGKDIICVCFVYCVC